jgi:hypothetical protein
MEMKVCTKCGGEPKPITKFGKRGKKRSAQCKECINKYMRDREAKKVQNKIEGLKEIENKPLMEEKSEAHTVQRVQLLPGNVTHFITIDCPCGSTVELVYQHSFDTFNDYYEGSCNVCNRMFKQTVTIIEDK